MSRAHNEAASETDVARPAREIALTIPIFTDEFVEHCERREKALKELRQESDQVCCAGVALWRFESDQERQTDRQTDRQRQRERETERQRDRDRDRQTETEGRERERETETDRQRERTRQRGYELTRRRDRTVFVRLFFVCISCDVGTRGLVFCVVFLSPT